MLTDTGGTSVELLVLNDILWSSAAGGTIEGESHVGTSEQN